MTKAKLAARNIARLEKEKIDSYNEIAVMFSKELLERLDRKYTGDPFIIEYCCGDKIYDYDDDSYVRLPNTWDKFSTQIVPLIDSILKKHGWLATYSRRDQIGKTPGYMSIVDLTIIADPEYKEPVAPLSLLERAEVWLRKCLHSKNS
jgi:hypothetical protein